ncbi:MAG: sortase [Ruminococcaceae bacterium]|nr:sortase [Oscillospiraceae bacterium]
MSKKFGIIFVIIGVVLFLSALLLFLHNKNEDVQAGQNSEEILADVKTAIMENIEKAQNVAATKDAVLDTESDTANSEIVSDPEITGTDVASDGTNKTGETNVTTASVPQDEDYEEMPIVQIDGNRYIGIITIPAIGIELPVIADWDYELLNLAPCRHFGSSATDDLVIAGHNFVAHFANLRYLKEGDTVSFTDMNGEVIVYAVEKMEILDATAVDQVLNVDYDLILYTCTYEGTTRVTVFCNRI